MSDMQTAASAWIEANSFRARQRGKVIARNRGNVPAISPEPEAAPAPEDVICEVAVSEEIEATKPGYYAYLGSGERIRVPAAKLEEHGLPTTLKGYLDDKIEAVGTAEARIHEALEEVVVGDPEGLAAERRANERLREELKGAYAELAALRRATAGTGRAAGKRFFESMGQAIEQDAEGLLDLLDTHGDDLPEEARTYLTRMSRNLNGFALNAIAYGQSL